MLHRMADQLCAIQNSTQSSPPLWYSENHPPKNIRARISTQEREAPKRGRDHQAIIFQHLIPDGNCSREAQLPSSSSQPPLRNSSFHLGQSQSQPQKLVPFASLTAISGTFNSLLKVLFIFPSQYLFAIGLRSIFSFRRKLPPILCTKSKVHDSIKPYRMNRTCHVNGALTLYSTLFQADLRRGRL